jgi:hypothetical protein
MANNYFTNKSITNVLRNRLNSSNLAKLGLLSKALAEEYKQELLQEKQKYFTQKYQTKVLELLHDIIHHQIAIDYHEMKNSKTPENNEKTTYGKNKQKVLINELKNISKKGLAIGMGITQMPMWKYNDRKEMKNFMYYIIEKRYNNNYIKEYSAKYLENIKNKMTTNDPTLNPNKIGFKFVKNRNSYNINRLNRDVLIYYDV